MGHDVDIEKSYSSKEVIAELRHLADALEQEKTYEIEIEGERIHVPPNASANFEYERDAEEEQLEIELKWTRQSG
jgi:amphi-Trp domain-containing protein